MDNAHGRRTDNPARQSKREAELLAIMEQSDRDAASGQIVPLADVLAELDEVAKEIEACRHKRRV